jgi:flagellar biosynthetic protein FliO
MDTLSFLWMIIQTIFALVVVCGLIYLTFRVIMPKLSEFGYANNAIRIVERTPIDARKSLLVIEVGGRWMLIATSENNVNLISELTEKEATEIEEKLSKKQVSGNNFGKLGTSFSEKLAEVMKRKG